MLSIKSSRPRSPNSLARSKPETQESTLRLDLARRLHETLAQDLAVIGYQLDEIIGDATLDKKHRRALRKIRFALSETTKSFRDRIYQLKLTSRQQLFKQVVEVLGEIKLEADFDYPEFEPTVEEVSNMAVLASVGSKLEDRLGTQRMAALVALLVPIIGVTQLTLTVALNAAAAAVGVRDVEAENTTMRGSRGALHSATQIVRHQVSVNTVSIGFSGVLFALNALAMRILSGTSTMRYAEKSPTQRNLPFFRSN